MSDDRHQGSGEGGSPVPRDMQDQQAHTGEDPWEVAPDQATDDSAAEDVPDTDEAGTGRQGAPSSGTAQTEHPVPDEPSA
ncbi:hypothetical protein [Streptomyces sp. NPDC051636]|uniref:hypothetical protein n=1 Tax=Streptomyces sp. NPDC051636 TaxID=3365663 RepID=UPI003793B65A